MQLKGSKVPQKIKNWPHAAVEKLDNTIYSACKESTVR